MVKEYKVIKDFSVAKVGDFFDATYDIDTTEINGYKMVSVWEYDRSDFKVSSDRSMELCVKAAEWYASEGFLEATVVVEECDCADGRCLCSGKIAKDKLAEIETLINDLDAKYEAKIKEVTEAFERAEVPACVKIESDTVHYNLRKLIGAIKDIIVA